MSESILFRGSTLKFFDLRQGKEGGDVFCRIHMAADFSEQVREAMEWDVGESPTDAKLPGELLATSFILTPGDPQLRDFELNFAITSVEDFRVVTLKDDDGEPCGRELRFIVRTPTDGVEGFIGQYVRRVGRHQGALKISYSKQPKEQTELDLQGDLPLSPTDEMIANMARAEVGPLTDEQLAEEFGDGNSPCILCNNFTPFQDDAKTIHATGVKCIRVAGATLSAASVMGGSHQKGTRGRRKPMDVSDQAQPEEEIADLVN